MATSKLQRYVGDQLDKHFPQYHIKENYKPDWLISSDLTRLELDFYILELKIAIEVQGDQHYNFVPFFHKTRNEFKKRRLFDCEKKDLCKGQSIRLIEVITEQDIDILIKTLCYQSYTQPKYCYQESGNYLAKNNIPVYKVKFKRYGKKKTDF